MFYFVCLVVTQTTPHSSYSPSNRTWRFRSHWMTFCPEKGFASPIPTTKLSPLARTFSRNPFRHQDSSVLCCVFRVSTPSRKSPWRPRFRTWFENLNSCCSSHQTAFKVSLQPIQGQFKLDFDSSIEIEQFTDDAISICGLYRSSAVLFYVTFGIEFRRFGYLFPQKVRQYK